jgi:hypothetical protein
VANGTDSDFKIIMLLGASKQSGEIMVLLKKARYYSIALIIARSWFLVLAFPMRPITPRGGLVVNEAGLNIGGAWPLK